MKYPTAKNPITQYDLLDLDHTEHFGSKSNPRVVRLDPCGPGRFDLSFSATGAGYDDIVTDASRLDAAELINGFLLAGEAIVGEYFDAWINQNVRECEVVLVKKTRARIEYEMPNTGLNGAWRRIIDFAGLKFLDGPYEPMTSALNRYVERSKEEAK